MSLLTRLSPATAIAIDLLQGHTLSAVQWTGLALIALSFLPAPPASSTPVGTAS